MKSALPKILAELASRHKLLIIQLASAAVAVLDVLTIALIFPILLIVVRPQEQPLPAPFSTYFGPMPETSTLYFLATALIGVILCKNIAMAAVMAAQVRLAKSMTIRLSNRLLRGYLCAPLEFHLNRKTAQVTRGIRDLPTEICFSGWLNHCNRIAEVAGVAAMVLALSVIEPIGMFAASLLLGVLVWSNHKLLGSRMHAWGRKSAEVMRRIYGLISDVFPNIKIIKTSDAEARVQEKFEEALADGADLAAKNRFAQMAIRPISEIVMMGAAMAILVSIMWDRSRAIDALPSLAAFTYAVFRLLPAINRISSNTNELKRIRPMIEEACKDLDLTRDFLARQDSGLFAPTIRFTDTYALEGVTYQYPGNSGPALTGIDLHLKFGEVIGLAGESGAGKSTLVDLLLGLLEPTAGSIKLDGQPPARNGLERGAVGYVPQNSLLLDVTARENIAFGLHDHEIDDARIAEAIAIAQLEKTISGLPGGLDGAVGEHGGRLSGGQRQRFGIARAIYGRPSLLILDEATSDLDTKTEFQVSTAINQLRGETTIVLVAHRLNVLKTCDRILFMQDGRIEAQGTYDTLLQTCPQFRELAEISDRYKTYTSPDTGQSPEKKPNAA